MVTWTVAERETSEAPTFSLTGVLICWPDGAPGLVRQTPFRWQNSAWVASVEVSRANGVAHFVYGTIRLEPSVAASWRRRRVNPRREAATQLKSAMSLSARDLGVIVFKS
jgi:hypothetical protein